MVLDAKKWIKINSNVNIILKYQNVPLFVLHLAYDIIKSEQKTKQKMTFISRHHDAVLVL